jgi:hypothetical protein
MIKRTVLNLVTFLLAIAVISFASPLFTTSAADQPFMKAARGDLQKAQSELRKATPDKGGHRVKALNLVARALSEVNAGIRFDRRNSHAEIIRGETSAADQPHMQRALDHLQNAKANLERATPDKGGHRAKAIDLVNEAIDEVNRGIAADRRNE